MKYIKTSDWFLNYKDIKNIYKEDEKNVNQKCDKKGNITEPGYTVFRIFIDYIDITGDSSAQSQVSSTIEEERDKIYNEIIEQVIKNEELEKKTNSKGKTILAE